MLAQNFMSATDLGITEEQHAALVKTLGFFERGEVPSDRFHMDFWILHAQCGTVHCIGGWAERFAGDAIFLGKERPDALQKLFYPMEDSGASCTDTAQGAHALRNYLTTGEADWPSVMSA